MKPRFRLVLEAASALVVCVLAVAAPTAAAARLDLPDPCALVAAKVIASAFGAKAAPAATSASGPTTATCSYKHGQLTISVGSTAITNIGTPAKVKAVPGLAHGVYEAFGGTIQTQVTFFKGADPATAIYGVVRQFARVPEKKLEAVARAVYAGLSGSGGPQGGLLPSSS